MSLCQSDHVERFDIKERVRSLDFVTRREDSGPRSFEFSRAHLYPSIDIMQEIHNEHNLMYCFVRRFDFP